MKFFEFLTAAKLPAFAHSYAASAVSSKRRPLAIAMTDHARPRIKFRGHTSLRLTFRIQYQRIFPR